MNISCGYCGSDDVFECQHSDLPDNTVDVEICCHECGHREWINLDDHDYMAWSSPPESWHTGSYQLEPWDSE